MLALICLKNTAEAELNLDALGLRNPLRFGPVKENQETAFYNILRLNDHTLSPYYSWPERMRERVAWGRGISYLPQCIMDRDRLS